MSTLATADLSSDDENDLDFKLPESKPGPSRKRYRSGSSSSSRSSVNDELEEGVAADEAKKLRADQGAAEAEERRARAVAAFESMKSGGLGKPPLSTEGQSSELVEIRRARRYAGETIYETIKLPADDPEVVQYRRRQSQTLAPAETAAESVPEAVVDPASDLSRAKTESASDLPMPKAKPPPRRKPRQSLEALSAAIDKGKKMTTLEKSQMDWKKHTGDDKAVYDELEANRKTGGYLQKRDFLDRVGERRMETFEDSRKGRR